MPTIGLNGETPTTRKNKEIDSCEQKRTQCPDCEEGIRITHSASTKNIIETCSTCRGTGYR